MKFQVSPLVAARLSMRNAAAMTLETLGLGFLCCVPIVLFIMPAVLPFDPGPYALMLGITGLPLLIASLIVRPRVLRPDFVNSIMPYEE